MPDTIIARCTFLIAFSLLAAWPVSAAGASDSVPIGCAPLPPTPSKGRTFYVDPARGSMTNDGSATRPWSTLKEVLAKGLIANAHYNTPYKADSQSKNVNVTGPIRPGDVIYLRSGEHGDVILTGLNDQFITIEAEPGQTPVISQLITYGASKWILRGVTFQNTKGNNWLFQALNHKWHGPSDNIILERNNFLPGSNPTAWSPKDWVTKSSSGMKTEARCSTLRGNHLSTVRTGIYIAGEHSLIENNTIDQFGGDGIDVLAGNVSILANRIVNNHDIGDANHNDGIQGWVFTEEGNSNLLIANNVIVNATAKLNSPGELQGITIFDGKWRNVRVVNNCVVTNHWHGIALYGVKDSIVEGNKLAGTDPKREIWITVTNTKPAGGGAPPRNVIVRNNIAPRFVLPTDRTQTISEGNKVQSSADPMATANACQSR